MILTLWDGRQVFVNFNHVQFVTGPSSEQAESDFGIGANIFLAHQDAPVTVKESVQKLHDSITGRYE